MSDEKHDGKLSGGRYEEAIVEFYDTYYGPDDISIRIRGGYGDIDSSTIILDARQALSLFAWLKQEHATLERLAQEQP